MPADTVPAAETADPAERRRRPWKVTYAGGRCLATFHYRDHALERAQATVRSGRLRTVWVRKRGEPEVLEVTRNRNEPPRTADEPL